MEAGVFTVEPWAVRGAIAAARPARRRPSRSSPCRTGTSGCAATSTRASRTPPGHVPERVIRDAAAALRRGRLRLPRRGPVADQRDQRQADPSARRRRAVRRALRHAASTTSACSTSATASCGARCEWVSTAGKAVRIRSTRLVSFVQRAVAAIRYEVEAVDAPARDRRAVDPGRQRARARSRGRRSPRRRRAAAPAGRRVPRAPRSRGRARAPDARAAGCGWRPPWTMSSRAGRDGDRGGERSRTWRASRSAPSWRPGRR